MLYISQFEFTFSGVELNLRKLEACASRWSDKVLLAPGSLQVAGGGSWQEAGGGRQLAGGRRGEARPPEPDVCSGQLTTGRVIR